MNMTLISKDKQGQPIKRADGSYLTSSHNCSAGDVIRIGKACVCLNCNAVADKAYDIQHLRPRGG